MIVKIIGPAQSQLKKSVQIRYDSPAQSQLRKRVCRSAVVSLQTHTTICGYVCANLRNSHLSDVCAQKIYTYTHILYVQTHTQSTHTVHSLCIGASAAAPAIYSTSPSLGQGWGPSWRQGCGKVKSRRATASCTPPYNCNQNRSSSKKYRIGS